MTGQGWDMIGFEQEHVSSCSGQYQELVQKITFPLYRWATATLLLDSSNRQKFAAVQCSGDAFADWSLANLAQWATFSHPSYLRLHWMNALEYTSDSFSSHLFLNAIFISLRNTSPFRWGLCTGWANQAHDFPLCRLLSTDSVDRRKLWGPTLTVQSLGWRWQAKQGSWRKLTAMCSKIRSLTSSKP